MIKFNATLSSGEWFLEPTSSTGSISIEVLKTSKIKLANAVVNKLNAKGHPRLEVSAREEDLREVSAKTSSMSFFIKQTNYELTDINEIKIIENKVSGAINSEVNLASLKADDRYRCPDPSRDGWYVDPDVWYFLITSMLTNKHILLRGDTGSGKTELVRYIASRFDKELTTIDMSILDGRTTLCGSTKLINGNTVIKEAKFAQKIKDPSFILLDELSRADALANNCLLPVLDNRRTLHMEELGDIENVQRNDDCIIWATANVGIEYTGTGNIDEAISNRFIQVVLNYAPIDQETEILINRTGINRKDAKSLAQMAEISRSNPQITHPVSTRQLLGIAEYVTLGFNLVTATRMCLGAIYSGRGDNSLELLTSNFR